MLAARNSSRIAGRAGSIGLCGLVVVFLGGCDGGALQSQWRETAPVIDGDLVEWDGAMESIEIDSGAGAVRLSLGIANDGERLHLGFSTDDLALQQRILTDGLTVWFDPEGGQDPRFGVRYPLGLDEMGLRLPEGARPGKGSEDGDTEWTSVPDDGIGGPPDVPDEEDEWSETDRQRARREDRAERMRSRVTPEAVSAVQKLYQGVAPEMELIRGPYSFTKMRVADAHGVKVTERLRSGALIYEMVVPLRTTEDDAFAVGLLEASSIGIGVSIPARRPRLGMRGDGRRDGFNGDGTDIERGRGPGGGGWATRGGPEGNRPEMSPIGLWTKVALSPSPDVSQRAE